MSTDTYTPPVSTSGLVAAMALLGGSDTAGSELGG